MLERLEVVLIIIIIIIFYTLGIFFIMINGSKVYIHIQNTMTARGAHGRGP